MGVDAQAWAHGSDVWARLGARLVDTSGPGTEALARWAGRSPAVVVVRPDRLALGIYGPDEGARAAADVRAALHMLG